MGVQRNKREFYDAKTLKPAPVQQGAIHYGAVSLNDARNAKPAKNSLSANTSKAHAPRPVGTSLAFALCSCLLIGAVIGVRRSRSSV